MISPNSEEFSTPYEVAEKYSGLDQSVINDILLTTFEQVEDIAGSLQVELNKEEDILRIVEKANMTLSRMSDQISESRHDPEPDSLPALDSLEKRQESTVKTLQAVAHEIRNPLTVIGGFARRLVASTDLDSAGSKYAHIILEEAARLEEFLSKVTNKTEAEQE
jgi:signal transduction histidine kinase